MARLFSIAALMSLVACDGGAGSSPPAPPPSSQGGVVAAGTSASTEELAGELAVRRAGCARCHASEGEISARVAPIRGPALAESALWHARDGGASFLQRHHGGDAADDLAAWVVSLATDTTLQPAATNAGAIRRGEELFGELACGACHAPDALALLGNRTDHTHVAQFLIDPSSHRPGVVHDFGLTGGEADVLAAWILRTQASDPGDARIPGFAWECFELQIDNGDEPELTGLEPTGQGVVDVIDIAPATRDNHFALRFRATLDVPAAGEWKFTLGSDDGSWLWLDGELLIDNAGLKPHKRMNASVQLEAGPHDMQVVYTQAGGGKRLELLWQGPGVEQQSIPGERGNARTRVLQPPEMPAAPDPGAVARGRAAAVARRCAACHEIDDPELDAIAAPAPARGWVALGDGACPESPAGTGLRGPASASLGKPLDDRARLQLMLVQDGCTSCHPRDSVGGLPPAVQNQLVETEDLGEEGRLPPDLTDVGARLRQEWIEKVLAEGHRVRLYLRVRMPRVAAERANVYAELFARVDGGELADGDVEPAFSIEAVGKGQAQVGIKGRGCVTCHSFAGSPSLGPHGMDLAIQHERVRPGWFREWLLRAPELRPGTRMPAFWPMKSAADLAEIDAIRTWLSLGAAAPVPEGLLPAEGSLLLLPSARPILHGAFLEGVSARCIAVGTAERTHYAFDVEHGRLVWIWRGDYLDATGTWHGRAGKLLKPETQDEWLVLEDFRIGEGDERAVLGHRVTPDGYPVFRVRAGDAEYEDGSRARLAPGGSELVRTLRCLRGTLDIAWSPVEGLELRIAGEPAPLRSSLAAGSELEVVYRW